MPPRNAPKSNGTPSGDEVVKRRIISKDNTEVDEFPMNGYTDPRKAYGSTEDAPFLKNTQTHSTKSILNNMGMVK